MTEADLIEMLVTELGFSLESTQFNKDEYIVRRPSHNPSYKTEYTTMCIDGDIVKFYVRGDPDESDNSRRGLRASKIIRIYLADPQCFDQLREMLSDSKVLFGSYASMEVPIAKHLRSG